MSLTLTTVTSNGGPLSAAQNDANMTAIMTEVNSTEAAVSTVTATANNAVSQSSLNSQFAGITGGTQQIAWANVVNKPATQLLYPFRITQSGSNQQLVVTGGSAFTATVTLNNIIFDPQNVCNSSASTMTAPVSGYYMLNASIQRDLVSGSPGSPIGSNLNLMKNGLVLLSATEDLNANTGEIIWRINELINLTAADVITAQVTFVQPGNSTWELQANPNTSMSGYLVLQTA